MVASADKVIIKTNRETIEWLKALSSQNLTMRQNLEEATIFFGRFAGDHRAFGSWKEASSGLNRVSCLFLCQSADNGINFSFSRSICFFRTPFFWMYLILVHLQSISCRALLVAQSALINFVLLFFDCSQCLLPAGFKLHCHLCLVTAFRVSWW